jgi:hypothetical protein
MQGNCSQLPCMWKTGKPGEVFCASLAGLGKNRRLSQGDPALLEACEARIRVAVIHRMFRQAGFHRCQQPKFSDALSGG